MHENNTASWISKRVCELLAHSGRCLFVPNTQQSSRSPSRICRFRFFCKTKTKTHDAARIFVYYSNLPNTNTAQHSTAQYRYADLFFDLRTLRIRYIRVHDTYTIALYTLTLQYYSTVVVHEFTSTSTFVYSTL